MIALRDVVGLTEKAESSQACRMESGSWRCPWGPRGKGGGAAASSEETAGSVQACGVLDRVRHMSRGCHLRLATTTVP